MNNGKAETAGRLRRFVKENRTLALLVCGGILLLLCASSLFGGAGEARGTPAEQKTLTNAQFIEQTEQKLQNILCGISGVDRCEVMITLETGIEYRYATDETASARQNGSAAGGETSETSRDTETKIALINDKTSGEQALLVTEVYPDVNGVAVICEGRDAPAVRLAVTEAVATVLGIQTSQVCVIMKG